MFLRRQRLNASTQRSLSRDLARTIGDNSLDAVVYIEKGGQIIGETMAATLDLPLFGLDVRYAFSRTLDQVPDRLRPLLWPLKELLYRTGVPKESHKLPTLPQAGTRILLVDDTASSGKTIRRAIQILVSAGINKNDVFVAVLRSGKRARNVVDHWIWE